MCGRPGLPHLTRLCQAWRSDRERIWAVHAFRTAENLAAFWQAVQLQISAGRISAAEGGVLIAVECHYSLPAVLAHVSHILHCHTDGDKEHEGTGERAAPREQRGGQVREKGGATTFTASLADVITVVDADALTLSQEEDTLPGDLAEALSPLWCTTIAIIGDTRAAQQAEQHVTAHNPTARVTTMADATAAVPATLLLQSVAARNTVGTAAAFARCLAVPGWSRGRSNVAAQMAKAPWAIHAGDMSVTGGPLDVAALRSWLSGEATPEGLVALSGVVVVCGPEGSGSSPLRHLVWHASRSHVVQMQDLATDSLATYLHLTATSSLDVAEVVSGLVACGQHAQALRAFEAAAAEGDAALPVPDAERKRLAAACRKLPLPEGWFYTGSAYVTMEGDRQTDPPQLAAALREWRRSRRDALSAAATATEPPAIAVTQPLQVAVRDLEPLDGEMLAAAGASWSKDRQRPATVAAGPRPAVTAPSTGQSAGQGAGQRAGQGAGERLVTRHIPRPPSSTAQPSPPGKSASRRPRPRPPSAPAPGGRARRLPVPVAHGLADRSADGSAGMHVDATATATSRRRVLPPPPGAA